MGNRRFFNNLLGILGARDCDGYREQLGMGVQPYKGLGIYPMRIFDDNVLLNDSRNIATIGGDPDGFSKIRGTGYLNITYLDTVAGFVSGTFEFHAMVNDTIPLEITEGRFDKKFGP